MTEARSSDATMQAIERMLIVTQCSQCDYDEAEGGLVDHCDECCRKVTRYVWRTLTEWKRDRTPHHEVSDD